MGLKRNSSVVLSKLKRLGSSSVICTEPCRIQVPYRFMDIGLGQIGVETYAIGSLAILLEDDTYAVMNLLALIELSPYKTTTVEIDNVLYYEFHFDKGDTVFKNMTVVKNTDLIYNIFDEYIFKGKVPWYIGYQDIPKIFELVKKYADSNAGNNDETIELITSMVVRSSKNRSLYIRDGITDPKQASIENITYVPLSSVFHSVKSTLNKIAGSHFSDGITSALVTETDSVSKLERILRA